MFKRLFGRKKKEKTLAFDPTNLTLDKLQPGWFVDFDMKTWRVIAKSRYDMGDGFEMLEWELESGDERRFLCREEDDRVYWTWVRKVPVGMIDPGLKDHILKYEDPPEEIVFDGITFEMESYGGGYFYKNCVGPGIPFLYWDYESENERYVLTIEQWGDTDFEAAAGEYVEEYQFSNILPSSAG
ncbi:MAG TPA: DUF4178 domain-containing protein [Thermodesulforhabdus norvegica]|uniref:DUF4178 domain-containing protein n=1 Tax=Thermodesulforhabdus norvegica TaxID=39841 RepID=A0A7C0WTQ3_9BACT|nr:DUF4178 domain-containing protein [Thermodesulforhabdus norvegica]